MRAFEFIHARFAKVSHWIGSALSEGDGSPSSKRLFFGSTVLAALAFCAFDITKHGGLTSEAIDLTKTTLFVTGSAYGITHVFSDKKEDPAIAAATQAPKV